MVAEGCRGYSLPRPFLPSLVPNRTRLALRQVSVVVLLSLVASVAAFAQGRTPSQEETVTWKNCGTTCGASAGSGAVAYGTQTLVSGTSLDGVAAEFALNPKDPYGNYYWYVDLAKPASGATIDRRYVEYVFSVYVPATYDTAWRGVEWGVSVRNQGWWWRSAYQLSKGSGFRFYDPSQKAWISTGVALFNFAPGQWHQVRVRSQLFSTSTDHRIQHLFIEIDGVRKTLTSKSNKAVKDGSSSNTYKASFQLDGGKLPVPYSVYFDKMLVSSWF